jgi:hypothetical protein
MRTFLLATLVVGMVGTLTELLLLGHFESGMQIVPLALLAAGIFAAAWQALAPTPTSVRLLRALMVVCVASGGIGVGLHYRGNEEFELEMYPTMGGVELAKKVVTGATPVLAPGSMVLLGLIGLIHGYRHPLIHGGAGAPPNQAGDA